MHLAEPRIPPLETDAMTPEQRELIAILPVPLRDFTIFTTLVRAPEAMKRFLTWGAYVGGDGTSLTPHDREIAILRTSWLCRSEYEWVHHASKAESNGLTPDQIAWTKAEPENAGWTPRDAAIVRLADDMVHNHAAGDEIWAALEPFSERERMDLVFTIGQYIQASTFMNVFGVQLESQYSSDPEFRA